MPGNGSPIGPRLGVSFSFFACGLLFASWAARIPAFKDALGLDEAQLGGILFMLPLGSITALPLAGWAVGRLGSRPVTVASTLLYAASLWSLSRATDAHTLALALFGFGFIGDFLNISMNTQGLSVQQRMGRPILSSLHAQWSFGAFAGAFLGGWSGTAGLGTEEHLRLVALLVALPALGTARLLVPDAPQAETRRKTFARPDRALLLLGLVCFCNTLAEGAMADWSSLYYRDVLGMAGGTQTTGYVAFTVAMAAGRLAGDRIMARLGYRNTLMLNGMLIAFGLSLALAIRQPAAVIVGFALTGLGVSSVIPIAYMIAGNHRSMPPAAALAMVSAIGFTGFLVGPPIIGLLAHGHGLRLSLLLVVALGCVITLSAYRGMGMTGSQPAHRSGPAQG
jgi:MFS family permease